jgi:hypothetical protein
MKVNMKDSKLKRLTRTSARSIIENPVLTHKPTNRLERRKFTAQCRKAGVQPDDVDQDRLFGEIDKVIIMEKEGAKRK